MLISLGALYKMDPKTADLLCPWMVLKETDQLSAFPNGEIPHLITSVRSMLSQFEFQVCEPYLSQHAAMNNKGAVDCSKS